MACTKILIHVLGLPANQFRPLTTIKDHIKILTSSSHSEFEYLSVLISLAMSAPEVAVAPAAAGEQKAAPEDLPAAAEVPVASESAPQAAEQEAKAAEEKPKKEKKPRAKKPRSAGPHHPPYFEMIKEALLALDGKTGSSPYAIAKYMEEKHKGVLPPNYKKVLAVQLKNFTAKGKLVKVKASFKLASSEIKEEIKEAEKTKKPRSKTARKPVAAAKEAKKAAPSPPVRPSRAKKAKKAVPAKPKPKQPKSIRGKKASKANKASA